VSYRPLSPPLSLSLFLSLSLSLSFFYAQAKEVGIVSRQSSIYDESLMTSECVMLQLCTLHLPIVLQLIWSSSLALRDDAHARKQMAF
jgi:hypothetical protein